MDPSGWKDLYKCKIIIIISCPSWSPAIREPTINGAFPTIPFYPAWKRCNYMGLHILWTDRGHVCPRVHGPQGNGERNILGPSPDTWTEVPSGPRPCTGQVRHCTPSFLHPNLCPGGHEGIALFLPLCSSGGLRRHVKAAYCFFFLILSRIRKNLDSENLPFQSCLPTAHKDKRAFQSGQLWARGHTPYFILSSQISGTSNCVTWGEVYLPFWALWNRDGNSYLPEYRWSKTNWVFEHPCLLGEQDLFILTQRLWVR